jgi:hypothetical protein
MKIVCFSETLSSTCDITRRNNPKHHHHHIDDVCEENRLLSSSLRSFLSLILKTRVYVMRGMRRKHTLSFLSSSVLSSGFVHVFETRGKLSRCTVTNFSFVFLVIVLRENMKSMILLTDVLYHCESDSQVPFCFASVIGT